MGCGAERGAEEGKRGGVGEEGGIVVGM